jgi:hypothetical protein
MLLNIAYMSWASPAATGAPFGGRKLVVIVNTAISTPGAERDWKKRTVLSWRILFHKVDAFRSITAERWQGPKPLSEPTETLRIATWEVGESHWLREAMSEQALEPVHTRHFVIASSFDCVDIAAVQWEVEAMGPWRDLKPKLEEHWQGLFS